MDSTVAALTLFAEKPPHEEGRDIVIVMLVVGLIFLGVCVLGELSKWASHRRKGH
jgi:hypothetical protein